VSKQQRRRFAFERNQLHQNKQTNKQIMIPFDSISFVPECDDTPTLHTNRALRRRCTVEESQNVSAKAKEKRTNKQKTKTKTKTKMKMKTCLAAVEAR
jgi:hypothetical protein